MTLMRPVWMQQTGGDATISYSGQDLRDVLSSLIRTEGILHPDAAAGGLKVTQRGAGANFSVDVAAGRSAIQGDDVADQGMYLVRNTAIVNVATPTAPGSGTRVHRLVAQVRDKTHNGAWTTYEWTLDLLQDTGSGTPAVPNSALPLARISIASGQSSVTNANITDDRADAGLLSGKLAQVSSDAGRPPNPLTSEQIWRSDKGCVEIYVGGFWLEMVPGSGANGWLPYTPSWTSSGTAPSLGNGTAVGRYTQVGKTVRFVANITMGSTTTYGSGNYSISLPATASTTTPQYVHCRSFDTSAGQEFSAASSPIAAASAAPRYPSNVGNYTNSATSTSPFTFAAGDVLAIYGTYEAA